MVLTGDQDILTFVNGNQILFLCQSNQEKLPGKLNFKWKEKEVVSSEIENPFCEGCNRKGTCKVLRWKTIFEQ